GRRRFFAFREPPMIAKVTRTLPETIDVSAPPLIQADRAPNGGAWALLQVLWRRRWTVLLVALACVGAGVLYLLKATPIYTSASRILVEQSGPKILSESDLMASR